MESVSPSLFRRYPNRLTLRAGVICDRIRQTYAPRTEGLNSGDLIRMLEVTRVSQAPKPEGYEEYPYPFTPVPLQYCRKRVRIIQKDNTTDYGVFGSFSP